LCVRPSFSSCLLLLVSYSSRSLRYLRSISTRVLPTSFPFIPDQLSSVATFLSGHQLRALLTHPQRFELAFVDSGASKMVTPFRTDFVTYDLLSPQQRESIDGFTSGQTTHSVGKGIVRYEVFDSTGALRILEVPAIHVPDAAARRFSPQWFSQHHPRRTQTLFGVENSIQFLDEGFSVPLSLDLRCNLPVLHFRLPPMMKACSSSSNLSCTQRLLLHWHNNTLIFASFKVRLAPVVFHLISNPVPFQFALLVLAANSIKDLALNQIYVLYLLVNLTPVNLFQSINLSLVFLVVAIIYVNVCLSSTWLLFMWTPHQSSSMAISNILLLSTKR